VAASAFHVSATASTDATATKARMIKPLPG
jgi:hypothetical protein